MLQRRAHLSLSHEEIIVLDVGFYTLVTLEGGSECTRGQCQVEEVRGTLIKVRQGQAVFWLNTAASTFISATPAVPGAEDFSVRFTLAAFEAG